MKSMITKFLKKLEDLYSLRDWRDWFSNAMALLFAIILPISYIYTFPHFIAHGNYFLIVVDIILWLLIVLRAFIKSTAAYARHIFWMVIFYTLTLSFFVALGPNYARPGWMVLCAVLAAIFYGVRGAIISSVLNVIILLILYFVCEASSVEWALAHKDGLMNWLVFTGNLGVLSLASSVSVGFLIGRLNRSLHAERLTKEDLQESELELKKIFNSSHDAFIIHEINGRILDVNDRMLAMYGLSREEALSMSIADISSADSDIVLGRDYAKLAIDGENPMFEWQAKRPNDDKVFDVEVGLKKLNWRGREVILASIRDLTERRSAEADRERVQAQLVQAQKMEAMGTLAGGIAHDFNNVLGGIMGGLGLVEILLKKENLEDGDKIRAYLQTAIESSKRAAEMTKQLLTLSRKRELKMVPVFVRNSINQVMNICRNSLPKSVDLDFQSVDPSLQVYADPTQIEQVLLNLCVNASHAMTLMRTEGERQGGKLSVAAKPVICDREFFFLHPNSVLGTTYVQIRVEDTGVGMDQDGRQRIFEPFYTTKAQDVGTGLGLAISYAIVRQHGGFIDVYSEPGKGSMFTVYLPQMETAATSPVRERPKIVKGSGRILVVDDEEPVLSVARGILEQCGYEVITANSAMQGIDLFEKAHDCIDAVVLDNSMPGMSGLSVHLAMRSIDPDVRVMLCSGFMDDATLSHGREMGIKEFIDKPYSIEEFSKMIKKLLLGKNE
jgi:two-component system, cell cycle sensor histidine kinase and response regulator CckA